MLKSVLERAPLCPLSAQDALALADLAAPAGGAERNVQLEALMRAARSVADQHWGRRVTFSPKVFLPLTNICRNRCDYCSFRRSPGDEGAWTMTHAELDEWLGRARTQGCVEALFCLGDKPERAFGSYRKTLATLGHDSTVDYLEWAAERALQLGLLPHTNAGILSASDMQRLKPVNVSLGLMLENISPRLCDPGMPHHRAPDKRPQVRVRMLEEAGQLAIPFTTGILIGIGETAEERVQSLLAIRDLHRRFGHIQEVIVQNFTPRPAIAMADALEPDDFAMAHAVSMARLILDPEISVQSPPNLNSRRTALLLRAGINDFGGISPVSPDYINPRHPWPHLGQLAEACTLEGFELGPRLPIYDRYRERDGFLSSKLVGPVATAARGLQRFDMHLAAKPSPDLAAGAPL
jgi:7,8-didemethyl-8-hydroxy-5-deazariboflavin synthase CofG subunit